MNSRHSNIKFTCEEENENKISFLDVMVTREGHQPTTTLFQKKTFSDDYNLLIIKKVLKETFLFRAYNICSDYMKMHQEILYIKPLLQRNHFRYISFIVPLKNF